MVCCPLLHLLRLHLWKAPCPLAVLPEPPPLTNRAASFGPAALHEDLRSVAFLLIIRMSTREES